MKQVREFPINPHILSTYVGPLSFPLVKEDDYFASEPMDSTLGVGMDALVEALPEAERLCVEYRVYARMSYGSIARELGWFCGSPPYPNRKRAWSTTKRAFDRLKGLIEGSGILEEEKDYGHD